MKVLVVDEFLKKGKPKSTLLTHVGLSQSSYYYVPKPTSQGKKSHPYVFNSKGQRFDLPYVLDRIRELLDGEFVDYGYYKTYHYLNIELGLEIGAYSKYKLMKAHKLLKFQRNSAQKTNKNLVKDLVPIVNTEFSFLDFDIKYLYIQGKRTNAQL